jgi:arylformamidase
MPWYDATLTLQDGMLIFPGDPPFHREQVMSTASGDPFSLSAFSLGTHCGTHVDAPAHYFPDGDTADRLPLDSLVGPAMVVDARGAPSIDARLLQTLNLPDCSRLLFKTDNGRLLRDGVFSENFVALTLDAAEWLVSHGTLLVGIDYLSIESAADLHGPVHRILLAAGVIIVECVDLLDVPAGPAELYCLPLKIAGGDGAPARVVLRSDR